MNGLDQLTPAWRLSWFGQWARAFVLTERRYSMLLRFDDAFDKSCTRARACGPGAGDSPGAWWWATV